MPDKKELFIDIETNQSLDPKTGIITQLSTIYRKNGKIECKKNYKDNPQRIFSSFTGDLNNYVDRYDTKDKMYFLAYNAGFDTEFVRQLFLNNNDKFFGSYFYTPSVCIMQLAAHKFMRKNIRPENFKLGTIAKYLNIKVDDSKLHDALYDITISKDVYNKLLKF